MSFLLLWLTMGLLVLLTCGIDDIVTHISLDLAEAADERFDHPVYYALCLSVIVVAWPMLLFEQMQKRS